jgi:hypothetical protein
LKINLRSEAATVKESLINMKHFLACSKGVVSYETIKEYLLRNFKINNK